MEDNKNYERSEHLEDITDASMKDDYFNASRNIDRKYITIEGARENNLKNINVKIPRDKFVVVTGLSGSGKSSLAFDTIYAEGQRRYMESLSSYARQFLGQAEKPDVDKIEGLSPAISIDQKSTNRNPRSTVGTVTEIYDYFRLLYARVGIPHCPNCGKVISRQTVDQMVDEIMKLPERTKFMVLAPVVRGRKGEHVKLLEKAKKSGFVRVVVDGSMYELSEEIKLDKNKKHSIDIVVDRLVVRQDVERRLTDSIETALQLAEGLMKIEVIGERDENGVQKENAVINFSDSFSCPDCGLSIDEIEPRSFSFNNPFGACPTCAGLGFKMEFDPDLMIPDQSLSINDGAIVVLGWQSCNDGKSYSNAILKALGKEYGFSLDLILNACARTMNAIHQPSFDYTESILKKWLEQSVKNIQDIETLDAGFIREKEAREKERREKELQRKSAAKITPAPTKFNNFENRSYDMSDLERKLLQQ